MRLNVKQHVLDYESKPLLTNKTNPDGSVVLGKGNRPVQEPETLRSYLVTALNNKAMTETDAIGAEEAARRYQLSTKLYAKNEVDLTLTERTLLLERIGALYVDVPLVYGRICDILEEREISLPEEAEDDQGLVVKNADLTDVQAKGAVVRPNKSPKKPDGGE
jgi:hypothetical protein